MVADEIGLGRRGNGSSPTTVTDEEVLEANKSAKQEVYRGLQMHSRSAILGTGENEVSVDDLGVENASVLRGCAVREPIASALALLAADRQCGCAIPASSWYQLLVISV